MPRPRTRSSREGPEAEGLYAGEGRRLGGGRANPAQEDAAEEVDPTPWKHRIPQGVKWTSPPYGAEAVRMVGVSTPGWSMPGGGGSSGSQAEAPPPPDPESRARALAAAEAREAEHAQEIAERRRLEEEEQRRRERQERKEEAQRKAREEERKAWARETLGLGPDGKPRRPPRRSRGARLLAACCRCFAGRGPKPAQAQQGRPEPLRI